MKEFRFAAKVNGSLVDISGLQPDCPLLWVLRDKLHLTGTKYGCGQGQCGACSVLIDGKRALACQVKSGDVTGKEILTIEGIAAAGQHQFVFEAWKKNNVPQCGYCQPGQVVTAIDLLNKNRNPKPAEIKTHMNQNLCRCGTYDRIMQAVMDAAQMRK